MIYIGDIIILVTAISCWWQSQSVLSTVFVMMSFLQCDKSVTNVSNSSSTHFVSRIRHRNRCYHSHSKRFNQQKTWFNKLVKLMASENKRKETDTDNHRLVPSVHSLRTSHLKTGSENKVQNNHFWDLMLTSRRIFIHNTLFNYFD